MPGTVEQALDAVSDEASFVRLLQALAADFAADREEAAEGASPYGRGPRGWQNGSVDAFLKAAAAWVEDSGGRRPVPSNPWRRCADVLYAGKFYE